MASSRRRRARFAPRFWIIVMVPAIALITRRYSAREARINEQELTLVELSNSYYEACMEGVQIRQQLETVGTEAFIERTARREYGYMMPGEARFVVTNLPEQTETEPDLPLASPEMAEPAPDTSAPAQQEPNPDPLYVPAA